MNSSIENPEKYIELFVLLNQDYIFAYIQSEILPKCENMRPIFYMGWKTFIHLFNQARCMQLPIKETYNIITRSITIYIEYVEQSIKSDSEYDNNAIDFGKIYTFIHKKAFDDQSSVALIQSTEVDISRIIKITNTILLWSNEIFTLENRLSINN